MLRPRLLDRLDDPVRRPLTLLSAPAGYGKSTLLDQWCTTRAAGPVTRVELADAREAVADRLRRGDPGVVVVDGDRGLDPVDLYVELAEAVAAEPEAGVHVLATSRATPVPALTPLRLGGTAEVLTAADLRFTDDELLAALGEALPLDVAAALARDAGERLDGWPAGAALLALAWPDGARPGDARALAAGFDAVADYLWSEVVAPLPEAARQVVLTAGRLDEVSGPLVDHVLDTSGSGDVLAHLRRGGAFVEWAPDDGWLQLHGLLRLALDRRGGSSAALPDGDAVVARAATWYAEHDRPLAAARCLAGVGDWDRLTDLLKVHLPGLLAEGRAGEVAALITTLPATVRHRQGTWMAGHAYLELFGGHVARAMEVLATAEPWLERSQLLMARILRAATHAWVEDPRPCIDAAESALALCDELGDDFQFEDVYSRSTTDLYRALARSQAVTAASYVGAWDHAARHLADVPPATLAIFPAAVTAQVFGRRATYLALGGQPRAAEQAAIDSLAPVDAGDVLADTFAADGHLALGLAAWLTGRAAEVGAHVEAALLRARRNGRTNLVALTTALQGLAQVDGGEPAVALALTAQYHEEHRGHRPPPTVAGLLAAAEARALAATGDADGALARLAAAPLTVETATARVAVAITTGDLGTADATIARWPDVPTVAGQVRRDLAVAAVLSARDAAREAAPPFARALNLAARHGLVQPVEELGPHLHLLLRRFAGRPRNRALADLLGRVTATAPEVDRTPRFTARELTVLHHLGRGLTLPAVATEMHLSVNTVKTHVQAVYRKLGATSRTEALAIWRGESGRST